MSERQQRKRRQDDRWAYLKARHRIWAWLKEAYGYDPVFMATWSDEELLRVSDYHMRVSPMVSMEQHGIDTTR